VKKRIAAKGFLDSSTGLHVQPGHEVKADQDRLDELERLGLIHPADGPAKAEEVEPGVKDIVRAPSNKDAAGQRKTK
jgi:hypothetical protein